MVCLLKWRGFDLVAYRGPGHELQGGCPPFLRSDSALRSVAAAFRSNVSSNIREPAFQVRAKFRAVSEAQNYPLKAVLKSPLGHAVQFYLQFRPVRQVDPAQGSGRRFADARSSVLAIADRETDVGYQG